MQFKPPSKLAILLLASLCLYITLNLSIFTSAPTQPSKLKIYVGPPKVPADNSVYEAIFVQLQDAKGNPARATEDIEISLSSSNTYVGSVDPVITIRKGETYATARFYSTYTPGTTTITAAASGFATVQESITTVGPIPSKLAVYILPPVLPADGDIYNAIIVQLQDSGGSPAKAPIRDVKVTLKSSNSTVGTTDPYVTIKGGETYAVARFYSTYAPGTTTITAMAQGYSSAQAAVKTQEVSMENATKLEIHIGPPNVPADGVIYESIVIQLQDSKGNIARAKSNIAVSLSSSDISVGSVSESITINMGETYALAKFYSTFKSGKTEITAAANGYASSKESITTVGPIPSKLAVYVAPSSLPADSGSYKAVIVQLQDDKGTPARDPVGNVTVNLFSSVTEVGSVEPTVIIPYGRTHSAASFHSTVTAGSAEITATAAGYASGKTKLTTYLIDEYKLYVSVTANPDSVKSREQSTIRVYVVANNVTPVPGAAIKISSDSGGSFSSVTDERNGYYTLIFTAPTVDSKTICTISVEASKTGLISGSGKTKITVIPTSPIGVICIYVKDRDGNPIAGAEVTSTSQPSGISSLSSVTGEDGSVTFRNIPAGSYKFKAVKEGYEEGSIEIQLEAYQKVTETLYINKKPFFGLGTFNFIIIIAAACAAIAGIIIWRIKARK